jgi:hypothetical protein
MKSLAIEPNKHVGETTTRTRLPDFTAPVPRKRPNKVAVIGILLATLLFALPGLAQLIPNPSFEQVQIGPPYDSSNPADIPGWTHSGAAGDALLWAIGYPGVTVAGAGNQFVTLGGGYGEPGSASWTTTITGLTRGKNYELAFKIANEGEARSQTMWARVRVSGSVVGLQESFTTTTGFGQDFW